MNEENFRSTRPIYGNMQGGHLGLSSKVKQKFREGHHRDTAFIHGCTRKEELHPVGQVWQAR